MLLADDIGTTACNVGVVQGCLDHALAVVEAASDTQCGDVVAEAAQLVGLAW